MKTDSLRLPFKIGTRAAFLAPCVACWAFGAQAQTYNPYQILQDYNAIVPGNFSVHTDANGGVIAGTVTNTDASNIEIYTVPPPSPSPTVTLTDYSTAPTGSQTYADTVIGTIQSGVGTVLTNVGNISYVSNPSSVPVTANGGTVSHIGSFNITPFTNALNGLQTSLGALTTNATTSYSAGTFTFNLTGGSNTVDVFNISGTSFTNLESATQITFSNGTGPTPNAQSVVINVVGGNLTTNSSMNFNVTDLTNSGLTAADVIWNFELSNGCSVNFDNKGVWEGSILAGNCTVTSGPNIDLEGSVYAENLYLGEELHSDLYSPPSPPTPPPTTPPTTPVPEPTTLAMLASGLAGLAVVRRNKRAYPVALFPGK